MSALQNWLMLSAVLFAIGLGGVISRKNSIIILMGVELMLNAANLNFIAFWRYHPSGAALDGIVFVLFSIAVAAAESAVGLALVIALYRHYKSANINDAAQLKDE